MFLWRGDSDRADALLEEAFEVATDESRTYDQCKIRQAIAWKNLNRGDLEESRAGFRDNCEVCRDNGFRLLEARAWNGRADATRFLGDTDAARSSARRYRALGDELGLGPMRAVARVSLAQVELAAGRPEAARTQFRRAREHVRTAGREGRSRHHFRLIRLALAAAEADWTEYDERLEGCRNELFEVDRVTRDFPWLAEVAGDLAERRGERERANRAWELGRPLWKEVGDEDAADRASTKLRGAFREAESLAPEELEE